MQVGRVAAVIVLATTALALAAPPCTCDAARLVNGWCTACDVGHVAAVRIESRTLFETLDAHGHDIDPAAMECEACRAALAEDGFCVSCRWGFVKEQLYFSRLTWILARGTPQDPTKLECERCERIVTTAPSERDRIDDDTTAERLAARLAARGWCPPCRRGLVGNVAYRDRADFDIAVREYARLLLAVRTSRRCEACAVVAFTGGRCRTCADAAREPGATPSGRSR